MKFRKLKSNSHIRLLYPRQTILCTSKLEDKKNIITLAWSMVVSGNPPIIAISISPKRFSHNLILKSKEFTINLPTKEIINEVYYCGTHSGRDVDKFQETKLTELDGINVNCPRIKQCISHIECKVINAEKYGDHTLFIGKVVSCMGREDILDGNKIDIKKVEIPYHLGGKKFAFNKKEIFEV
ncbi:MAG: flavin reductase family protein [Promethearchaeota archaeon]